LLLLEELGLSLLLRELTLGLAPLLFRLFINLLFPRPRLVLFRRCATLLGLQRPLLSTRRGGLQSSLDRIIALLLSKPLASHAGRRPPGP